MTQEQQTPNERSKVMYTDFKLMKAKESLQGIYVYTKVQSRKITQREHSVKARNIQRDRTVPKSTQEYSLLCVISCDKHKSEGGTVVYL